MSCFQCDGELGTSENSPAAGGMEGRDCPGCGLRTRVGPQPSDFKETS